MTADQRLFRTISEYLCTECKTPIYLELGGNNEDWSCINRACILYMPDIAFVDVTRADQLKEEIESKETDLRLKISEMNRQYFTKELYMRRGELIRSYLTGSKIHFRELLAIDDLLSHVGSNPPTGKEQDLQAFRSILSSYQQLFEHKCFIEDIENMRYLMSADKKVYMLKYWKAILDFYETHGIVAEEKKPISEMFRYSEIDTQAKETVELRLGGDFGKYFQQMFDFIINLGYMFEYQYLTAEQHRYDPTGIDIGVLMGLWMSAREEVEEWSYEGIRRHFNRTSRGKESFDKFYEKYVSGRSLAPVIVFDGRNYLFDRYTILLYALYLMGRNQRASPGQTIAGARDIDAKREEASNIFEERVRGLLREAGFKVPSGSLRVREQNEEHEYDAIGVDEANSNVVIVEAKYRDFSPSSLTGNNLVRQELLDKDRLLDWATDTQEKLEFFLRYPTRFEHELSLMKSASSYKVSAWVVTKHKPLISRYRSVQIVDFYNFPRRVV